jgi:hypothetical protein
MPNPIQKHFVVETNFDHLEIYSASDIFVQIVAQQCRIAS